MQKLPLVFWSRWIMFLSLFLMIYGLAMVFAPHWMNKVLVGPLLYHTDTLRSAFTAAVEAEPLFLNVLSGLLGTVTIGYAVLIGWIGCIPFRQGERWAWNALAMSVSLWAVFELYFKLVQGISGVGLFAHFGLLIAFGIPLVLTYTLFRTERHPALKL